MLLVVPCVISMLAIAIISDVYGEEGFIQMLRCHLKIKLMII